MYTDANTTSQSLQIQVLFLLQHFLKVRWGACSCETQSRDARVCEWLPDGCHGVLGGYYCSWLLGGSVIAILAFPSTTRSRSKFRCELGLQTKPIDYINVPTHDIKLILQQISLTLDFLP